jgi:YD repeat-containing protein
MNAAIEKRTKRNSKLRDAIDLIGYGHSTTIYDASGRVTGHTSTSSNGTTTIYASDGRRVGSVTTTKLQASR